MATKTSAKTTTKSAAEAGPAAKAKASHDGARDAIEAVVVAFILAFLFRTFEAEAFVIPTGSMAPGLMGAHHDLTCEKCGYRFQVNAGDKDDKEAAAFYTEIRRDESDLARLEARANAADLKLVDNKRREIDDKYKRFADRRTVEGTCPICRHTMRFEDNPNSHAYSGDRLIVTKYPYEFGQPSRFDVAVFKFPLGPSENYIKRIVGLPNEEIRGWHGDLFTRPKGSLDDHAIARKPLDKLLHIAQIVHDNDYVVSAENGKPDPLLAAGWPARWQAGAWRDRGSIKVFASEETAWKPIEDGRSFQFDAAPATSDDNHWLRYRHIVPSTEVWSRFDKTGQLPGEEEVPRRAQLITDYYAYNTNQSVNNIHGLQDSDRTPGPDAKRAVGLGVHWVGDLMLECEIEVAKASPTGTVTFELVEGSAVDAQGTRVPCRFQCRINLATGQAMLDVIGVRATDWSKRARQADTVIQGPGKYRVRFANFDDQLLLWVDDTLVEFSQPTEYRFDGDDVAARNNRPTESDLAPIGIQVVDADATIRHLQVKRDIYYIATRASNYAINDYADERNILINQLNESTQREFMSNPRYWSAFDDLQMIEFKTGPDDFLAMGDNSPQSYDGRLWQYDSFVPRRLLIGEALFIYWPHSWFFPVPNVPDMGFVR